MYQVEKISPRSANRYSIKYFILTFLVFYLSVGFSQTPNGYLKGYVIDGSTYKKISNVKISHSGVSVNSIKENTETLIDGSYLFKIDPETYTITYSANGYQSKKIDDVIVRENEATYLNVFLYPIANGDSTIRGYSLSTDSLNFTDSVKSINFKKESHSIINTSRNNSSVFQIITSETISPGTDKNAAFVLRRLNGAQIADHPQRAQSQSLTVRGLGERYNQLLLNGAIFNSFNSLSRVFPIDFIPTEITESVSLNKIGNPSIPADFGGGSLNLNTKEYTEKDFFYLQAGSGFSDKTIDKQFLGNKSGDLDFLSFAGKNKDLPSEFPDHKSEFSFNQLNIQEKVRLSKLLNNNLSPENSGKAQPNLNFMLGYGKSLKLKGGEKIGIVAYLKQRSNTLIQDFETQAIPDVANNPFPFSERKILVKAQSVNTRFNRNSDLGGFLNATIAYKKSKISFKNILGSMLNNSFTAKQQYKKYDEDQDADAGVNYFTDSRKFLISQLSGVHGLGEKGDFKLDWIANYSYYNQKNPDERNFLLNRDGNGRYEIANNAIDFINSSRSWTKTNEKSFFGNINIEVPFNLLNHAQVLSGGINIQTKNKVLFSDLLLYSGRGFHKLDSVLSPDRYYQGGLNVSNYFIKDANLTDGVNVSDNSKGNYTASSNIGASYLKLESKINNFLSTDLGFRLESSSNLVSNIEYRNTPGLKFPQLYTMNENSKIIDYNFLPSVRIKYQLIERIKIYAAYFKSVNRAQLQELSQYRYFDANSSMVTVGNPLLANTNIDNVDLGFDLYTHKGTSVSLAGFYKRIDQPIENVLSMYANKTAIYQSTPFNMPMATIKGVEMSMKSQLDFISKRLSNTTFFASANLLESMVKRGYIRSGRTPEIEQHTLSGSPNYSINAGFTYSKPKMAEFTLLYNTTADYITAVGSGTVYTLADGNKISAIPDYRVKGKHRLDFQISKKLLKSKAQLIMGVNNLLNTSDIIYQDLNGNKKFDKPIKLTVNDKGELGYLLRGVDNTVINIRTQPLYYLTFSYQFN